MNNENIGNITTIGKIIAMPLAGWAIGFLISHGINLPIDQQQLSEAIFIIILFIWGLLDAKYPNALKWFGNKISHIPLDQILEGEYDDDEG